MCIEHLSDGRLLIVDSAGKRLLRREPDGTLAQHADFHALTGLDAFGNDIVVDGRGAIYVITRVARAIPPLPWNGNGRRSTGCKI